MSEAVEHQADRGQGDHRLGDLGQRLIVLGQPLPPSEPAERSFDHLPAWTEADSAAARAEGWDLIDVDGEMQIQRLDDAAILRDDIVTWRLVARRACHGSTLHCKALRCASPREVAFIRRVVRPDNMPLSI